MKTQKVGWQGKPPKVLIQPKKNPYEEVYTRAYAGKAYREFSPGHRHASAFWQLANPITTHTVIDWGCGTGRGGFELHQRGLNVRLVDFVAGEICLDDKILDATKENDNLEFIKLDFTQELDPDVIGNPAQFGYCVDVLEHIPEEDIDQTLENILSYSRNVYFQICTQKDHFGAHEEIKGDSEDDIALHICVHNYSWWLSKFAEHGVIVHSSEERLTSVIFYVTKERSIKIDSSVGTINVSRKKRIENIRHSASLGLPSIAPHKPQDQEVMLLAGGPSLSQFEDEIIQNREDGMKLVTVNGTYCWAKERGLKPSLQFLVDSRDFNKRFAEQNELTEETKYVVTSVADPSVFDYLPADRTYINHSTQEHAVMEVIYEEYGPLYDPVFPVPGGCTVTLRAICALRMLGFYKIHIYGFDSCVAMEGDKVSAHHAYDQQENDKDVEQLIKITLTEGSDYEKAFYCAPWMLMQVYDFQNMIKNGLLDDVQLDIKGDGVIAHLVNTAADLNTEDIEELEAPTDGRFYGVQTKK